MDDRLGDHPLRGFLKKYILKNWKIINMERHGMTFSFFN